MEVRSSRNVRHWRSHLTPRVDYVDSEGVHSIAPDIVPVDSGDENLALVVVAKQPPDHDGGGGEGELFHEIQILPAASQCRAVTDTGRYGRAVAVHSHKIEY